MNRFIGSAETLKRLVPFSWFSETQLAWALPAVECRSYRRDAVIQRAGEEGDGLYIVVAGHVSVLHEDGHEHELVVSSLGPHEFFGELGLFDGQACAASVRADTDSEVLFIPRRVVLECLDENPRAAVCMLRKITARLCETHSKLARLALSTVEERVASVLLEHGIEADGAWHVQVGSERIASLVAASREMVSRVIKKMIAGGIVRRERRKLVVVDRDAVASHVGRAAAQHAPERMSA